MFCRSRRNRNACCRSSSSVEKAGYRRLSASSFSPSLSPVTGNKLSADDKRVRTSIHRPRLIRRSDVKVKELIGRGGYAKVYRGKWRGVEVAIKRVMAIKSEDVESLYQESSLMVNLRHPHVLAYLGTIFEEDTVHIVTEYASIGSLKTVLSLSFYPLIVLTAFIVALPLPFLSSSD